MKVSREIPIGVVFGALGAAWLAWGFAHPQRKVLNLLLMIGLFSLYTVTVAFANATSQGEFRDQHLHVASAVTFVLVAAFYALIR